MTRLAFKVWCSDDSEDGAVEIPKGYDRIRGEAIDAETAAVAYVDQYWSDMSYPDEVAISVRDPDGTLTRWTVTVEMVPHVTARLVKETG